MTLNKSSRLGLYAVVTMAQRPGELVSAATVAAAFGVSEDHVAKVLQQLVRARIVTGVRGVGGGYHLAADARRLTMLDVVEALEGPLVGRADGVDGSQPASHAIRAVLAEIGQYAAVTLGSVTIATLAAHPAHEHAVE
jgi:Rrf2 family protein